jgi:hypothetical protein
MELGVQRHVRRCWAVTLPNRDQPVRTALMDRYGCRNARPPAGCCAVAAGPGATGMRKRPASSAVRQGLVQPGFPDRLADMSVVDCLPFTV